MQSIVAVGSSWFVFGHVFRHLTVKLKNNINCTLLDCWCVILLIASVLSYEQQYRYVVVDTCIFLCILFLVCITVFFSE